ncbi:FecCD family ABC transporter permease [Cnuibacter sp. UC19_7]|uniref:FecCD family ABC transporter permease n=1 Tax=Cnuibacter sp. UC19_7 TaxID=3350166 RepID=UPI00366B1195
MTATAASAPVASGVAAVRRPRRRRALALIGSVVVLGAFAAASILVGSREVGIDDVLAALGGSIEGFDRASIATRIPRTLLAMIAGAALGVSGAAMQGVTRNPLADPGILGVTMGASLAVVCAIAWFGLSSATVQIWIAIGGAAVAAVFVYAVGSLGRGGATPLKLALAGAATSAALASFISAVVLPRADIGEAVRSWEIGGVGGATMASIQQVAPFLAGGFVLCLLSAKGLNSLALGDELAAGLGERVALTRGLAALGSVVLCGAATAVTGPIAFVGLVVPHACRLLVGVDHRWLIPFSAVVGAALLTGADILGRIVARPSEIDVGIITALIGAPVFIYLVRRRKVGTL